MKTLAIILHYNTIALTDALYEMLKPYERDDYTLMVLDNGSDAEKTSQYTTYRSDENTGFGGGLDMSMQLFLDSPEYDSFMILNSDLVVHGYNFIRELRKILFADKDMAVVTPCVIQPMKDQGFWRQMHNWGHTTVRHVPFVDYQCPMMKRMFVEKVKAFRASFTKRTYSWQWSYAKFDNICYNATTTSKSLGNYKA